MTFLRTFSHPIDAIAKMNAYVGSLWHVGILEQLGLGLHGRVPLQELVELDVLLLDGVGSWGSRKGQDRPF